MHCADEINLCPEERSEAWQAMGDVVGRLAEGGHVWQKVAFEAGIESE